MVSSVTDQLTQEMACEELLECLHGLKSLDRECYDAIVASETPLTVDDVADRIGRERSTAYRSIQRLLEHGLLEKGQINYEQGGYYHVYYPADPERIARDMQRVLNDWYATMGQLIHEFEATYDRVDER
ncbi:helix-turn-helix domain-containing protein [Natronolimnohabitans innermongolicus]|uniref:TrmB family transcriptional regulator n=1 Tax=Natronolimnohabitans innermongolicus JCM 12255 TaxID=1227499 RepID=L9WL10_9EURY|nr:helix-turn-helix domain-containing protein [Natronolimnohabitans innermongolicus]ELY50185.1 TrmB family transcriptional regulator [Natronolimnohabitans innermongolicus JCM 12255]